jgi:hypothetical protein
VGKPIMEAVVPTSEIIEAVQEIIDRKRRELEKKQAAALESVVE